MKKLSLIIATTFILIFALTACSIMDEIINGESATSTSQVESQSVQNSTSLANSVPENTQEGQSQSEVASSEVLPQQEPEITQAYTTTLEDIKAKGTLIIGIDENFAPMSFTNDSGEFVGFDVDLAKAICASLGVQAQFKAIDMTQKVNLLNSGEIDCVLGGLAITNDRQESMNLSGSYLVNILSVFTTMQVSVGAENDLVGLRIGMPANSSAHEIIKYSNIYSQIEGDIVLYSNYDEVVAAMNNNEIDCMIVDEVYYNYKLQELSSILYSTPMDFGDIYYTVGLRKADIELHRQIDSVLVDLKSDGTLSEISINWLGSDVSVT